MFSACAPDEHLVQNAPYQGLKPILFLISTARLNRLRANAGFEKKSSPQRLKPVSLHSSYVRPKGRTLQGFFSSLESRQARRSFTAWLSPCPSFDRIPMLFSLEAVEKVVFAYILVFLCDRYASSSEQLPVLLGS
jgi:hypothetical protein